MIGVVLRVKAFTEKRDDMPEVRLADLTPLQRESVVADLNKRIETVKFAQEKAREIEERGLLEGFVDSPLDDYANALRLEGYTVSETMAYDVDLTSYLPLEFKARWESNTDISMNILGTQGKGKSNALFWLMQKWGNITGVQPGLKNVTFNRVQYNLLLKSLRVRLKPDGKGVFLESFEPQRGDSFALDEAADTALQGSLAIVTVLQTRDIEARMRAKQIARFACGTRPVLRSCNYVLNMYQRDHKKRKCWGLLYRVSSQWNTHEYLGYVVIPYVDEALFKAYEDPKMASIDEYSHGSDQQLIASLMDIFAEELKVNVEFQGLPMKPKIHRINWLKKQPRFSVFSTLQYYEDLWELSKNWRLHCELTGAEFRPKAVGAGE